MGISIVDRKKILDDVITKLQRTRDTGIIMDDMSYVKFKDDIIEFIESVYENIEFVEIFADTSLYLDTTKPMITFIGEKRDIEWLQIVILGYYDIRSVIRDPDDTFSQHIQIIDIKSKIKDGKYSILAKILKDSVVDKRLVKGDNNVHIIMSDNIMGYNAMNFHANYRGYKIENKHAFTINYEVVDSYEDF